MFEFFALVIAIVAFIFARKAFNQIDALRARLDALEAAAPRAAATPVAPPPYRHTKPPSRRSPPTRSAPKPPKQAAADSAGIAASDPDIPAPAPQAGPGFEERIGTRWVVWVGGLTLALGGFFLVRYSIEQGLLGPGVRVLLGGLFALALLAAGEWTRRKESFAAIEPLPIANIPAVLTAAGTAVAFATVYAAYALYDFLVPATAFILLGMVALGTLAAALLHGPALAGLGIAAAFVTPILVSSEKPDFWALYLYLAVVTAAAFGLARIRLWRWLAVTTIVLATLWTFPCLQCGPSMVAPHAFHVIAGFILAALLVVCGFMFGPPAEQGRIEPISSGALAAYLFGATLIVLNSFHADTAMIVFALLVAGTLFVAWRGEGRHRRDRRRGRVRLHRVCRMGGARQSGHAGAARRPAARHRPERHRWLGLVASDHRGDLRGRLRRRRIPGAGPLRQRHRAGGMVGLRRVHAAGAADRAVCPHRASRSLDPVCDPRGGARGGVRCRDGKLEQARPPAGIADLDRAVRHRHAGAIALALTFALEKGWLTIALALMSLGTAWISMQRPIPFLRWLAAILAGIVVARIGYEPRIVGDAVGATPIFNWLLWGYGIPALSFWAASILLRRRGDDAPLRMVEAAAILFTVLLAFMEIRHAVNDGNIYGTPPTLPRSRWKSASRWRWRSGWSGCASAPAASCTMSVRSCSRCLPDWPACSA